MPERDRLAVTQEVTQILGGPETTDLLGNVIRSDRHKAGRAAPAAAEPDTMTSHRVIRQYDNETSTQSDHKTGCQASKQASPEPLRQADAATGVPPVGARRRQGSRNQEQDSGDLVARRLAEAKRMAESATTTVTLRLPRELNDWLDEYVHRAWPERVRKQELVIEGLRMLLARRGRPGEPILLTALLPEESP